MRKIISILYSFLLMTSIFVSSSSSSFAITHFTGGDGSSSNPYLIKTAEQLYAMRNEPDAHYALISDIDVSELIGTQENPNPLFNNGLGWLPIGSGDTPFSGFLDGRGYAITGLYSYAPKEYEHEVQFGLFGVIDQAFLYNFDVEAHIIFESSQRVVGGVLAHTALNSTISGIKTNGSITSRSSNYGIIGGLLGRIANSAISNVDGNVSVNVYTQGHVGGLLGSTSYSTITNVINRGDIHAKNKDYTGGIIGFGLENSLHYLQNNGTLTSHGVVGGILGGGENVILHTSINRGNVFTEGTIAGAIVGELGYSLNDTSLIEVSLKMLINKGDVISTHDQTSSSIGLIGKLHFNHSQRHALFYVNDLINMSSTSPILVGTIQDRSQTFEIHVVYSGIRATLSEISFDAYSPLSGFIQVVNHSDSFDVNHLDNLVSEMNRRGLDLVAENKDNSLKVHFAQLYYFTQGKLLEEINQNLFNINTSIMLVLPGSLSYVPLFEEFADIVDWDFSNMIGWNTKLDDTGRLYRPSDSLDYKEGEVFVRVFSTSSEVVEIISEENNEENEEVNNEVNGEVNEEENEEVNNEVNEEVNNEVNNEVNEEVNNEENNEENEEVNNEENNEEVNKEIKEVVVNEPSVELEEMLPDTSDTSFFQYLYLLLGFRLLFIGKKK